MGLLFVGNIEQLDLKSQDSVGWYDAFNALVAVSKMWTDYKLSMPTNAHANNPAFQSCNGVSESKLNLVRGAACISVLNQITTVEKQLIMDTNKAAAMSFSATADDGISDGESWKLSVRHIGNVVGFRDNLNTNASPENQELPGFRPSPIRAIFAKTPLARTSTAYVP
ncbi:MAG: hypothetical protein JWO89_2522 [Verrucomicrobiaceae bacterium]|nr:hypothetical protein [Verrucomicrobiaceae bacterium]